MGEKKINDQQHSGTQEQPRNNRSVCVCVTEEESVCGEKAATVSDFHRAILRNSAENMIGKR